MQQKDLLKLVQSVLKAHPKSLDILYHPQKLQTGKSLVLSLPQGLFNRPFFGCEPYIINSLG